VSGRAHKGRAQGGQVGRPQALKTIKDTAALRVDRALADTSPASARLLGKTKTSQREKRAGRFRT